MCRFGRMLYRVPCCISSNSLHYDCQVCQEWFHYDLSNFDESTSHVLLSVSSSFSQNRHCIGWRFVGDVTYSRKREELIEGLATSIYWDTHTLHELHKWKVATNANDLNSWNHDITLIMQIFIHSKPRDFCIDQ